jgi:hypothetical protein
MAHLLSLVQLNEKAAAIVPETRTLLFFLLYVILEKCCGERGYGGRRAGE